MSWTDISTGLPFRHRKNDFDFSEETFITSVTATTSDSQRFITSYGPACMCAQPSSLVCSWVCRKPQQRCPVTPLQSNVPVGEMTLSLSLSLLSTTESISFRGSQNLQHACVCIFTRVKHYILTLISASSELNDFRRNPQGVVSWHIATAVPTCTLAWLDHLSLQRLWGPPHWTCAVPCVYTRSLASVGNVYPAEVQQCRTHSQLYCTDWKGSHLGHMYWPMICMYKLLCE